MLPIRTCKKINQNIQQVVAKKQPCYYFSFQNYGTKINIVFSKKPLYCADCKPRTFPVGYIFHAKKPGGCDSGSFREPGDRFHGMDGQKSAGN